MEVKFEVKMTQKIMYNFLMTHTYRSAAGILGTLFGVSALVLAGVTYGNVSGTMTILYALFGVWFLAYTPYHIYIRSKKQVLTNPFFKKPITYLFNEEGIITMQGDQQALINWKDLLRVTETKISLLIYTGKRYSFVLPKESMADQYETVLEMIKTHVDNKKIKIKGK